MTNDLDRGGYTHSEDAPAPSWAPNRDDAAPLAPPTSWEATPQQLDAFGYPDFSYDQPSPAVPVGSNFDQGAESRDLVRSPSYPQPEAYSNQFAVHPQPPALPGYGWAEPDIVEPAQPPALQQTTYQSYPPITPAPPYFYPQPGFARIDHPFAVVSLVLALIGIFLSMPLLSPVAWYLGARGRKEVAANPGRWAPSGALNGGFYVGMIGTLLWGLILAAFIALMVIGIVSDY